MKSARLIGQIQDRNKFLLKDDGMLAGNLTATNPAEKIVEFSNVDTENLVRGVVEDFSKAAEAKKKKKKKKKKSTSSCIVQLRNR